MGSQEIITDGVVSIFWYDSLKIKFGLFCIIFHWRFWHLQNFGIPAFLVLQPTLRLTLSKGCIWLTWVYHLQGLYPYRSCEAVQVRRSCTWSNKTVGIEEIDSSNCCGSTYTLQERPWGVRKSNSWPHMDWKNTDFSLLRYRRPEKNVVCQMDTAIALR